MVHFPCEKGQNYNIRFPFFECNLPSIKAKEANSKGLFVWIEYVRIEGIVSYPKWLEINIKK